MVSRTQLPIEAWSHRPVDDIDISKDQCWLVKKGKVDE